MGWSGSRRISLCSEGGGVESTSRLVWVDEDVETQTKSGDSFHDDGPLRIQSGPSCVSTSPLTSRRPDSPFLLLMTSTMDGGKKPTRSVPLWVSWMWPFHRPSTCCSNTCRGRDGSLRAPGTWYQPAPGTKHRSVKRSQQHGSTQELHKNQNFDSFIDLIH